MWWMGAKWFAATASLTDSILNSAALALAFDFDAVLFDIFAPRRVQISVKHLGPLPLARAVRQRSQVSAIEPLVKMVVRVFVITGLMT